MNLSKDNALVSIVLVNWNGKKWLSKCLTSLNNQSYEKIEIIFVDNASSDGSVEYVEKKFPRTKIIINEKNLGYPRAANIGIAKSKGMYLLLMNNDMWVRREFVSELIKYYKSSNFSVISPIVRGYSGKELAKMPNIDPTGSPAYFFSISRADKLFYLSSSYFCSREEYTDSQGFDDNYFAYYEDVDWFWRLNLLKKRFGYAKNIYLYHEGAGTLGKGIKYKMFLYRNQNALQTLLKNYSVLTLLFIVPLYILQNIIEIIFFLIMLKPNIAFSYIQGWWFNILNLKRILKKRRWIQKRRKISDIEIMKKMYLGPAKLRMLLDYKT